MQKQRKQQHGMSRSPEYRVWKSIKQRCHNPNHSRYSDYGGRGVIVAIEWRDNFMAFYQEIGPKPHSRSQIDRIDNELGYEPGNVRWVDSRENSKNRRNTIKITHLGQTKVLKDWASDLGFAYMTLIGRYQRGIRDPKQLFVSV